MSGAVAAATGLGQPGQFFKMLRGSGLSIHEFAVPDHGALSQHDLDGLEQDVVLVTARMPSSLRTSLIRVSGWWKLMWLCRHHCWTY